MVVSLLYTVYPRKLLILFRDMSIYLHSSDTALVLHQSSFRHYLEAHATEKMEEMFRLVPFACDFHKGDWIDEEYYKRHIIEAIIRIKLNNEVDAYCLQVVADPAAAVQSLRHAVATDDCLSSCNQRNQNVQKMKTQSSNVKFVQVAPK